MKYLILSVATLTFYFSWQGCIYSAKECNSYQEPIPKTTKLKRNDLPINVSDSIWQIFEDVQNVEHLEIQYDYSRKNGTVSENVSAQYSVLPSEYKHGIVLYTTQITERELAHEGLHSKMVVLGYPFFYRVKFPVHKSIANLENEIQHYLIYMELIELGITSKERDISSWRTGIEIMGTEIGKLPARVPDYVLNVMGATWTIGGLNRGISRDEISEKLPQRLSGGFSLGEQIYNRLREVNLLQFDENFQLHLWIASLLNLTADDLVIGTIDFQERNRKYYHPIDGRLLSIIR